jgi:hypothetical protein
MVPTWKREFDALVEETMAFAASVNERKLVQPKPVDPLVADAAASEGDANNEIVQADVPVLATLEAVLAEEPTVPSPLPEAPSPLPDAPSPLPEVPSPVPEPKTWPARLSPMTLPPSDRDEIKQRVANFKAHQLKMQAEREDYYSQTMARARASAAGPTPPQKTNKRNGYTSPVLIQRIDEQWRYTAEITGPRKRISGCWS